VDRWADRYADNGLAGPGTHPTPPVETGLSHWSSRQLSTYLNRAEGVAGSWHHVAKLWRDNDLQPHRQGAFKLSRDPRFAEKVAKVRWVRTNVRRPSARRRFAFASVRDLSVRSRVAFFH
jgi:hypothetical protein